MQPFNEKDCEEEAFQRFFFEHNIQLLRLALLIAAPLYMLFGFWDHLLAPELIGKTLAIRGFVMVFLITLLIFSYTTNFISYYKPLVATATLLAAMGVTAILVILPEGEVLGVSGVLLVIFFLTIFNILFFWTLLAGSSIVIGFTAYTSFFSDIEWEVIASSNFFLVSGAFLAASAAYQTERVHGELVIHQQNQKVSGSALVRCSVLKISYASSTYCQQPSKSTPAKFGILSVSAPLSNATKKTC